MVTQTTLRELRNNLKTSFSTFNSSYSITSFVESEMRKRYTFAGFYNDDRCSIVYREAVNYLESAVNNEYNKIAKQINEYVDELKDTFETNHSYGSSGVDSFKHVAIGAGAGLGAAILLGGPVGWMIGIGAGIAALYSSSEKKKELISSIRSIADKLNDEAISKLSEILDLYIVEEAVLLPPPNIEELIINEEVAETLSPAQLEIKKFLDDRNIKYLVHFTDASRIDSIKRNGLCSPKEGRKRGINIIVNDNGLSAHKAEKYMSSTPDDYISLTITSMNEKVLSAYKARRGIRNVKRILIDACILWREVDKERIYCNMNASSGSLSCGKDLKSLEGMFAPSIEQVKFTGERVISTRRQKPENVTTHEQAEILWLSFVDPKYFIDCDEQNNENFDGLVLPDDDLPF